tara:strand:+ start:467 stop:574 length:108 start_codon:yes stop_codon:yes gene_type:complete
VVEKEKPEIRKIERREGDEKRKHGNFYLLKIWILK